MIFMVSYFDLNHPGGRIPCAVEGRVDGVDGGEKSGRRTIDMPYASAC